MTTEQLELENIGTAGTPALTSDRKHQASCGSTPNLGNVSTKGLTSDCKQNPSYVSALNFGDAGTQVLTSDREQCPSCISTPDFESAGTSVLTSDRKLQSSCAFTLLPNGIDTEGRPIAGVDWSRFEIDVYERDKPVAKFPSLAAAAPNYNGYIWAIEATADSYELQNRQVDLDAIKAANIKAYCSNPKYTSRYRIQWQDIAKSNEADAGVIYRIFTETKITWSVFRQLLEKDELRDTINKDIIMDRYLCDGAKAIEVASQFLPAYKDVPEQFRALLYDSATVKSKAPRKPKPRKQVGRLLITMLRVREANRGWRTLRRQIGNYGQGYGGILRSEYYWWWVRTVFNARAKAAGIAKEIKASHIDPKTKEEKQVRIWSPQELQLNKDVMREAQTVLKWLWKLTASKV